MTSVKVGGFYDWPYSYWGQHLDPRVMPQRPDLVEKAIVPDYALSSHVAPLGLAFYTADSLPQKYRGGAFVGEHGSWNRYQFNGYKVVFAPFSSGASERQGRRCCHGIPQCKRRSERPAGRGGNR
jgi:glucose/arabinose dehydrogenase